MKLFGTDGIRGRSNEGGNEREHGSAHRRGRHFRRGRRNVVVGKDTRPSIYMARSALTAGMTSTGMTPLLDSVPVPAVGYLTRPMDADLGIMISANRNPYDDNGIKFFGPDGFKLGDADGVMIGFILSPTGHDSARQQEDTR